MIEILDSYSMRSDGEVFDFSPINGGCTGCFFSIMPPYGQSRISGRQGRFTVHVNKVCPSVFGGRNMENGLFL